MDNGSNDGSIDFLAFSSNPAAWHSNTICGIAEGNNVGAKAAQGRYIAFLNNDAAPRPGWLAALRNTLDRDDTLGIASVTHRVHARPLDRGQRRRRPDALGRRVQTYSRPARSAKYLARADIFWGVRRRVSLFVAICSYRPVVSIPRFLPCSEDVDLSYTLFQLSGSRCRFVPEAVVHHAGSATLGRLSDQSVFWGQRNMEWMYLKNTPWPLLLFTFPGHVLYNLAAAMHFARMGMFRTFARAKWAAFCELPRVWRQRGRIQRERQISWIQLWRLMDRRWLAIKLREKRFDRSIANQA